MRFFPRTARRSLLATTLVAVMGAGALNLSLASADDLKDRQKQVQKDINHAHSDLEHSSARFRKAQRAWESSKGELASARAALAVARSKVSAAEEEDARMQAALVAAEAKLATARAELATGKQNVEDQQGQVVQVVTDIYTQGDPQLLAFSSLLDSATPADLTRGAEAQSAVVGRETRAYDDLSAAKVLLQVTARQVREATDEVAASRQAAADHLVEMESLEASAASATATVAAQVKRTRKTRASAVAARAADRKVLRQLEAEANRIKEKLRQQALNNGANNTPGNTGGFLNHPVNGRVTSPYGYRTHPIYGYYSLHDGTDFGAGCGTPLYATADGTIMQKYWSTVYGNRLVLNHGVQRGVGVASVYNHATRYVVRQGQKVKRGQVIGYVGSTGWSTGCHLHFTVLVNGSAVNPMNWL